MKYLLLTLLAVMVLSVSAIDTAFAWEQRLTVEAHEDKINYEFYDTEFDFMYISYEHTPTSFYEILFKTDSAELVDFIDTLQIGHKLNSIELAESPSTPEHRSGYYEILVLEDCTIIDTPSVNFNYADFALVIEC